MSALFFGFVEAIKPTMYRKQLTLHRMCTLSAILKLNVSIWSPLAEAFNARPMQKYNFRRHDVVGFYEFIY